MSGEDIPIQVPKLWRSGETLLDRSKTSCPVRSENKAATTRAGVAWRPHNVSPNLTTVGVDVS